MAAADDTRADRALVALQPASISALTDALAAAAPQAAMLRAIHAVATREIGVTVFSASLCKVGTLELERIYSSEAQIYPVGVLKSKRGTSWARQVIEQRQVFVGEGELEMAAAFDDKEQMARVGIRSIINVPVTLPRGELAVLNFGRSSERVAPGDVGRARLLGLAASAGFALARA